MSGGAFFQDEFEKIFRLKHYKYPYYIDYEYEYETKTFITICNWLPVLKVDVPTVFASLEIINNSALKICSKKYNISDSVQQNKIENQQLFITSYLNTVDDEIFSPNPYNSLPRIIVIPDKF